MAASHAATAPPPRGQRKRARTRAQLVAAGLRVLARRGEAFTVSDVVAEAELANGTFYNYFPDRDAFVAALAEHSLRGLTEAAAAATRSADPALRFAVATARVLRRAEADPTWGRVVLRLVHLPTGLREDLTRHLVADLEAGRAAGRFAVGAEDATVDQVLGLLTMAIRRIAEGEARPGYGAVAVERALAALGVPDAGAVAAAACAHDGSPDA